MRDALKDLEWMDHWISFSRQEIEKRNQALGEPSFDPNYRPQFVFDLSKVHLHLLLRRYSRGDPIRELHEHFPPLLDAWEEAERLGRPVWSAEIQRSRHSWRVNLDHYIRCFWLVGLALALELDEALWQRLVALVGNEGEDALLDRVIASRQKGRRVGASLCHPKPYQRLLDAVNAPATRQPTLLKDFVEHWYQDLDRPPQPGMSRMTKMYEVPSWYEYHNIEGAYFGYWCIEAVAAAKALGMDDHLCRGLPHYPGDLLHPDGPSTHPAASATVKARAEKLIELPTTWRDRVRKQLHVWRHRP